MMDASNPIPVQIQKYIRLTLDKELCKSDIRKWYHLVETYGPTNVISSVAMACPNGKPTEVVFVHRKTNEGKHIYDIPLKRDLTEKEAHTIIEQWDDYFEDGDFLCEVSQSEISGQRRLLADAIVVKDDSYEKLCEAIAKSQHAIWMNERVAKGWRFGERVNPKAKTHPMLRPWQDLPEDYRKIDLNTPQMFLEELNRMGFAVVKSDELEKLIESAY